MFSLNLKLVKRSDESLEQCQTMCKFCTSSFAAISLFIFSHLAKAYRGKSADICDQLIRYA